MHEESEMKIWENLEIFENNFGNVIIQEQTRIEKKQESHFPNLKNTIYDFKTGTMRAHAGTYTRVQTTNQQYRKCRTTQTEQHELIDTAVCRSVL